jgi:hypothetical protein
MTSDSRGDGFFMILFLSIAPGFAAEFELRPDEGSAVPVLGFRLPLPL